MIYWVSIVPKDAIDFTLHTSKIWKKMYANQLGNVLQVAVLLMDTQGTFDTDMTVKDCASMFALSNLISSVQV